MSMLHSTMAMELLAFGFGLWLLNQMTGGLGKMGAYLITIVSFLLFLCTSYSAYMMWTNGDSMMGDPKAMMDTMKSKAENMMENGQKPASNAAAR